MAAHFGLAHGHGVDQVGDGLRINWGEPASLFAAVFANEDQGEGGFDLEGFAEFGAGRLQENQIPLFEG